MKEVYGDIWDYHWESGKKIYIKGSSWIVITTNGSVRKDGACVMGRGVAKQAALKFPMLPFELGKCLKSEFGNTVYMFMQYKILTFPVKHNWREKADLNLIEKSCKELVKEAPRQDNIYMVRPGCGNGGLDWKDVKPVLEKYLDDRFTVVERSL